ncbi:hypothetical protein LTR70_001207 [Exophiala xenobiotica]|uniref:Uncharacterized protein n=1 Tax=Lithohypha guttulata TaxID=1690604 RepID=A0ABR0KKD7_9EURO|nr:hypothetical protein LTR24_001458 [Lithohypha guttulata]KAK5328182.1 hypothetical protein LTR70_001207 [Exophiala xenobiotica]
MADRSHSPGSRAIKIPISRLKNDNYTTPSRRRSTRDDRMQRTDSTEGSSSEATSTPRTREVLKAHKTIASPAGITAHKSTASTFMTPPQAQQQQRKDKHRADLPPPNSVPARAMQSSHSYTSPLSPSMLSSSSYKSVNLNSHLSSPDEPPRLICYTKHSQGFTWNDELFLPSYLVGRRYRGSKARRRWGGGYDEDEMDLDGEDDVPFDEEVDRCPVADIFVTDEEAANMLP